MIRGFSLVEVLIAALILSVLVAGICAVLNVGDRAYNDDMGLLELQQEARLGMEQMLRELRQAAVTSLTSNSIIFDISGAAGIRYYLDAGDVNNDNIASQIIREYPAGTYKVLANDINSLSFCWHHPDDSCTTSRDCGGACAASNLLKIDLGSAKTAKQRALSFALSQKVKLRNE